MTVMMTLAMLLVGSICEVGTPGRSLPDRWDGEDPCVIVADPVRGVYFGRHWPGGVVPYEFDPSVTSDHRDRMMDAMGELEAIASVLFVPRAGDSDYLVINSENGNSSSIGMAGGAQQLSITSWDRKFVMVHELMHALGAAHEHQRPDRNNYVQILWDDIDPDRWSQFEKLVGNLATKHGVYDFESVMHYRQCSFPADCDLSCGECATIVVLPPNEAYQDVIGQKDYLSDGDAALIAFLYGSPGDVDDAYEDNDTVDDAAELPAGVHALQLQDDADYFLVAAGGAGGLVVSGASPERLLDAWIRVLDVGGGLLAQRRFAPGGVAEHRLDVDAGLYIVEIERLEGHAEYTMTVGGTAVCAADLDGSGVLNEDDIAALVEAFLAGDLTADLVANGVLNLDDLDAFVAVFLDGCP